MRSYDAVQESPRPGGEPSRFVYVSYNIPTPSSPAVRTVASPAECPMPVRLVMTFDDALRITWLFLLAGVVLGIVIGVVWLIIRVVWGNVFGF